MTEKFVELNNEELAKINGGGIVFSAFKLAFNIGKSGWKNRKSIQDGWKAGWK